MFRGSGSLLHTQHHKHPRHSAQHAHPHPHHHAKHTHHRRRHGRWLGGAAALLLLLAAAMLLYRRAPQAASQQAGSEEEQRDSEAELRLLHEQPSAAFCARPSPPLVCAHGGDINAAPPNTAAAFAAALAGGSRCVEVDVARTKDGQLVVLHSRELAHLLHLAGRAPRAAHGTAHSPAPQVGDYTWAELAALRWEGGERVELVESVVRRVLGSTDQVTLDIKTYSQAGEEVDEDVMAQEVVNLVQRIGCRQCLVWAKSDVVVRLVKELLPGQPVGYVVMNETAAARAAGMHRLLRMPGAEVVALHYAMATHQVTARVHAARKQAHAWTANTAGMMRAVLDAGVDAVVTNHPRRLADAIASRLRRCAAHQQQQQQGIPGLEQQGLAADWAGTGASEDRSELRRLQQAGGQQPQQSDPRQQQQFGPGQAEQGQAERSP
ncbi:hypothetical protein ABPG75_009258 [Micractinium tetrahymenae]